MSRMSARYAGKELGLSTEGVYDIWEGMGLVKKDNFGDWSLTDKGRNSGGKLSQSDHPVPTFDLDKVEGGMCKYYKKKHR